MTDRNFATDWDVSITVRPSNLIPNAEHVLAKAHQQQQDQTNNNNTNNNNKQSDDKQQPSKHGRIRHHYRLTNRDVQDDTKQYWKNQKKLGIALRHAFFPPRSELGDSLRLTLAETRFAKIPRLNAIRRRARVCFLAIYFLCAAFRLIRKEGVLNIRVCDNRFVDETHDIHLPTGARCVALPEILSQEFQTLAINRLRVVFQPIVLRRLLRKQISQVFDQNYREVPPPTTEDLKLSSTFFSLFPNSSLEDVIRRGKMRTYSRGMWVGAPRSARSAARSVVNRSSDSKLSRLLPTLSSSGVLPAITPSLYSAFIVLHGIVNDLDNKECSLGQCYGETCAMAEGGVSGNGFKVSSGMALTWEVDVNDIVEVISNLKAAAIFESSQRRASIYHHQNNNNTNTNTASNAFSMTSSSTIGGNTKRFSESTGLGVQQTSVNFAFDDDNDDDQDQESERPESYDTFSSNSATTARRISNNNNNNNAQTTTSSAKELSPQKCFDQIMNHIIELRIQIISQHFRPTIDQIQNWELFRAASTVDIMTHILPRLVPKVFFAHSTIVSPESTETDRGVYLVARGRVVASASPVLDAEAEEERKLMTMMMNSSGDNNYSSPDHPPRKEWKTFGEYEGYFSESFDLTYEASTIVDCWVLPRTVIQSIAKIPYLRPDMILRGLRLREEMLYRCGPSRTTIEYVLSHHLGRRFHPRLIDTVLKTLQPKVFPAGERVITAGEDEKVCIFFIRGKLNQSSANGFIPHAPPAIYGPQSVLNALFDPSLCVSMSNAVVVSSWKLSLVAVRNVECWIVTVSKLHSALKIFYETCDIPNSLLVSKLTAANAASLQVPVTTSNNTTTNNNNGNTAATKASSLDMFHFGGTSSQPPSTFASPSRTLVTSPARRRTVIGLVDNNNNKNAASLSSSLNASPSFRRDPFSSNSNNKNNQSEASSPSYLRLTKAASMRRRASQSEDQWMADDQQQQQQTFAATNNTRQESTASNQFHQRPKPPSTISNHHHHNRPQSATATPTTTNPRKQSTVSFQNMTTTKTATKPTSATTTATNDNNNNSYGLNLKRPSPFHDESHKIDMNPFKLKTDTIGLDRLKYTREEIEKEYSSQMRGPQINEWLEMPFDDDDPRSRFKKRRMSDLECLKIHPQPPDKRFLLRMRKLPQTPRLHGKNFPEFGDAARKKKAEELLRLKEQAANDKLNFRGYASHGNNNNNAASSSGAGNDNHHATGQHRNSSSASPADFMLNVSVNNNTGSPLSLDHGKGKTSFEESSNINNDDLQETNNNQHDPSGTAAQNFRRRKIQAEAQFKRLLDKRRNPTMMMLKSTSSGASYSGGGADALAMSLSYNNFGLGTSQQQQQTVSDILSEEVTNMLEKHEQKIGSIESARKYQMGLLKKAAIRAERYRNEPEPDRL